MKRFWDITVFGNGMDQWMFFLAILVFSVLGLVFLKNVVIERLRIITIKTKSTFDDFLITLVRTTIMPLLYGLAVYSSLQVLSFSSRWRFIEQRIIMIAVTILVLKAITTSISYFFKNSFLQREQNEQRRKQSRGIILIAHAAVWLGGVLFLIDNLGYDITTLIAGLGIGGIAIALASQAILGDLFSYLVIFFDKPFEIGDFIIVEDKMGTVEYIGIKTTRLRTLGGEQLICSNTDLTNARVHNYKRMQERRVVFGFGIVYDTPAQLLAGIPGTVKSIIESLKGTRFDRCHFKSFGGSSLDFEVVYFIQTPDYNQYMDIQQQINLALFENLKRRKIEFAFPTQTLYVKRDRLTDDHEMVGRAGSLK